MFVDKMYLSTEIFDDIEKDNSVPDFCNAIKSEVPGKFSCLIDSALFTSGLNHIISTVDNIEANFLNFTNLIKNHKENIATEEKYLEQSFGNMPTITVEKLSDGLNTRSTLVSSATIASGISGIPFMGTRSSERIINNFANKSEETTKLPNESENNRNNQKSEIETTTNKDVKPTADKQGQTNNSKINNGSSKNTTKNYPSSSNTSIDNKETPNTTEEPKNDIEDGNINNSTKEDNQDNINIPNNNPNINGETNEKVTEKPKSNNTTKNTINSTKNVQNDNNSKKDNVLEDINIPNNPNISGETIEKVTEEPNNDGQDNIIDNDNSTKEDNQDNINIPNNNPNINGETNEKVTEKPKSNNTTKNTINSTKNVQNDNNSKKDNVLEDINIPNNPNISGETIEKVTEEPNNDGQDNIIDNDNSTKEDNQDNINIPNNNPNINGETIEKVTEKPKSNNPNISGETIEKVTEEPNNDIQDNIIDNDNSTKEDNQENINMPEYPKNNDEIIEEVIETPTIKNDIKQEDSSNINIGTILGIGAASATVGVINSKIKEKKDENRSKS